uniref:NADH-ubiquinone oxidoreductase chain 4L n=1 Tax=Sweltsa longistyla TaxID=1572085 RepID=A0A0C4XVY3_9NEOP|nr:NADH dehydrogenase subunit 4L [Sweltsa longistyla]
MSVSFYWLFPLFCYLGGVEFLFQAYTFIVDFAKFGIYSIKFIYSLFIYLNLMNCELFFSMAFLTFSVCEGALGLSILVSMIRTHGNDYFQSFSILQC